MENTISGNSIGPKLLDVARERMRVRHLAEFVGVRAEFADDGLPSPATSAEPSAKTAGLRENWVRFYDPDTGLHEARISYPCELR